MKTGDDLNPDNLSDGAGLVPMMLIAVVLLLIIGVSVFVRSGVDEPNPYPGVACHLDGVIVHVTPEECGEALGW